MLTPNSHASHFPLDGQADGSEYRLPGDGHWPSFNVSPGDLVVIFRHKARTLGTLGKREFHMIS